MATFRIVSNPPNPYESRHSEWLQPPPQAELTVYEEQAKSILCENESPDLPFRWSCNPYRGCQHACAYCYARPYHEYLGFGAGTDFDSRLVVKVNAPELLEKELSHRAWTRESINFCGVTDCYQPLEAAWQLTRRCLEVCLKHRNPVAVVTKGFLVVRDAELLFALDQAAGAVVYISIPFADDAMAKLIEPQATTPTRRFEAIRQLRARGIPTGVLISPIIPGLNDRDIPTILRRAREAGAVGSGCIPLRLPGHVADVFFERLREALPLRARRIETRIREMRGGRLNVSEFGGRFRGQGTYWESVMRLYHLWAGRYGLEGWTRPAMETSGSGGCAGNAIPLRPVRREQQLEMGFGD